MAHDQPGSTPPEAAIYVWDWLAAGAIAGLSLALGVVAAVNPDAIKEYTQSVLAILFVVGAGYLQVEQPMVDHSVIWAIVGTVVAFYFGTKGRTPNGP